MLQIALDMESDPASIDYDKTLEELVNEYLAK